MKKFIIAITIVLICVFCLLSCASKEDTEYPFMVSGISEGNSFLSEVKEEFSLEIETEQIFDGTETYTATINGEMITGVCIRKHKLPFYKSDANRYRGTMSDGAIAEFVINPETKKLVGYDIKYTEGYEVKSGDKTYDECYQIALDVVETFDKPGEFTYVADAESKYIVKYPEKGNLYCFYFRKSVNGKKTSNMARVDVNIDGRVMGFLYRSTDEMDNNDFKWLKSYEPEAEEELLEKIEEKIMSVSKTYDPEKNSISLDKTTYMKLKDGNIYAEYEILINKEDYTDAIRLLRRIK